MATNKEIVEGAYASFAQGDIPAALAAMDESIEWTEADGYLLAGTYVGPQAVLEGVFMRLGEVGDEFAIVPDQIIAEGDTVVALACFARHAGRRRLVPERCAHQARFEFNTDIAENQILRTAADRLRLLPGLTGVVRTRLRHVDASLAGAALLHRGMPIPGWRPTRLNQRFHLALWLAELIIRQTSLDQPRGTVQADGFVVDMAKVFEDFVTTALGSALEAFAGTGVAQRRLWLDEGSTIPIQPDLTWLRDGVPVAVIDAKYKAEKPSGFPNADVYQMLAYCTALGLTEGHLVYAKGNDAERSAVIRHARIAICCHALDLDAPPDVLLSQVDQLAKSIGSQAGVVTATGAT